MSNSRAVRYRRLDLAAEDKANADLLLQLADDAAVSMASALSQCAWMVRPIGT